VSLTTIDFQRLHLRPGQRVLDLGCGEGRHAITAWLHAPVHVVGLDLSAADLATAAQRAGEFHPAAAQAAVAEAAVAEAAVAEAAVVEAGHAAEPGGAERHLGWVRGSGLSLPFADACFDRVICAEVLEHIPDYQAVLREIRRVLKPGGVLAVSVPRYFPEWVCWQLSRAYHEVAGGHVRIFRTRALTRTVEAQGLRRFHQHWAHSLHVPYWWLRCLFWDHGEKAWPVRTYHRLLVWDLLRGPWLTRALDRALNPLMGKSLVVYFTRNPPPDTNQGSAP
jgi:ubiquinone/menaquinone biosynthesis C-methylase UbiE